MQGVRHWPPITWVSVSGTKGRLLEGRNQLYFCSLLESWRHCYTPSQGACILGGGTATLAQRIPNGFKKILQVLIFSLILVYILCKG